MKPINALAGGRITKRNGLCSSSAASRASTSSIAAMHDSMSRSCADVVLGQDEDAHAKTSVRRSRFGGRELDLERLCRRCEVLRPVRPDDDGADLGPAPAATQVPGRPSTPRAWPLPARAPRERRRHGRSGMPQYASGRRVIREPAGGRACPAVLAREPAACERAERACSRGGAHGTRGRRSPGHPARAAKSRSGPTRNG